MLSLLPPVFALSITWNVKAILYAERNSVTVPTDGVIVDSSPRYSFHPLVPYRIKMVRPGAKFVVVLRDPTDRYFFNDCSVTTLTPNA